MADEVVCPYATEPVEIILSDRKVRRVRFTAGALRRASKDLKKLGDDATPVDSLIIHLMHGILPEDRADIKDGDALAELIDARAVSHLSEQVGLALKEASPEKDPTPPAPSPTVN